MKILFHSVLTSINPLKESNLTTLFPILLIKQEIKQESIMTQCYSLVTWEKNGYLYLNPIMPRQQNGTMTCKLPHLSFTATTLDFLVSPEPQKIMSIDPKIIKTNKEMLKWGKCKSNEDTPPFFTKRGDNPNLEKHDC